MPLDLWFRDDVSRILAAAHETFRASIDFRCDSAIGTDPAAVQAGLAYQQGFCDALRAVAVAFGLTAPTARPSGPAAFAARPRPALPQGATSYPYTEADRT